MNPKIIVRNENEDPPWGFAVRVEEGKSFTEHRVTMDRETYERISAGKLSPEECVQKAFEFLLKREPKESILRSFDITKISYYFPDFEKTLLASLR